MHIVGTSMSCSTNDKGNIIYSEDLHKLKSLNMALKIKKQQQQQNVITHYIDSDWGHTTLDSQGNSIFHDVKLSFVD